MSLNAQFKRAAKHNPKRVGTRTQSCVAQLLTSKLSNMLPSNCMVAFTFLWSDAVIVRSSGGHLMYINTLHKLGLFMVSNAFVRSTEAMKRDIFF